MPNAPPVERGVSSCRAEFSSVVDQVSRVPAASCSSPCRQVGAVIVSPTRELARQIFEVAAPFVATVPWLHAQLLVGGT